MNFGRVYTILYSLVSVSIFLPSYVSAQDFIVDIEDAYRNLKSSYVRLNNVVESCLDKKARKIVISDTWLRSQPIEKKKAILFFFYNMKQKITVLNRQNWNTYKQLIS